MKKTNFLFFVAIFVAVCASFTACDDDDKGENSPLVGTWESIGYYNSSVNGLYPESTADPISDTSEKIIFKSNGKGVYSVNGSEKEFNWKAGKIGIEISIASSIHYEDKDDDNIREYFLSATELCIMWSNARQYVYRKVQ